MLFFSIDDEPNASAALLFFDFLDVAEKLNGGLMRHDHAGIAVDLPLDPNPMKGFLGKALDGDLKPAIENGKNSPLPHATRPDRRLPCERARIPAYASLRQFER